MKPEARSVARETKENSSGSSIASEISGESFQTWYSEREFAENIRQGTPYFNGPGSVKAVSRYSPSNLLQCQRKITYQQLNAPEENTDPNGIFWFGTHFEEDLIVPFLQDTVADSELYVANSLWVDFTADYDSTEIRIKGSTDPVIVDRDSQPLLLTEVKTKSSIENVTEPNLHHKAQAHAYMYGLSQKHGYFVTDSVILYGSRTQLDVKSFHVEFDPGFWSDVVLGWAASHTKHRSQDRLPPQKPEFEWECEFCPYRNRCGMTSREYTDVGPHGLLPRFEEYPREKLTDYLESHDGAKLTPTLATVYPDLVPVYGCYDWSCETCGREYDPDTIKTESSRSTPPRCPNCSDNGGIELLTGPTPEQQHVLEGEDGSA